MSIYLNLKSFHWCMVWTIIENLRVQKNLNIEKIIFKVVQMKFLAMHLNNQKLSFDIFTVQNIFMEHDFNILMIFGIKDKCIILTHTIYCLFLQICCLWLSPGTHIECEYFTLLLLQLHFRSNKCSLMSRRLFFQTWICLCLRDGDQQRTSSPWETIFRKEISSAYPR